MSVLGDILDFVSWIYTLKFFDGKPLQSHREKRLKLVVCLHQWLRRCCMPKIQVLLPKAVIFLQDRVPDEARSLRYQDQSREDLSNSLHMPQQQQGGDQYRVPICKVSYLIHLELLGPILLLFAGLANF
jgi:hypothetical protein